jgi:hypothetical protein
MRIKITGIGSNRQQFAPIVRLGARHRHSVVARDLTVARKDVSAHIPALSGWTLSMPSARSSSFLD